MKNFIEIILLILFSTASAFAGVPASFTYQGIVMNSAGTAPLTSVVSLKLSLYDPTGTCLLYQEQQANIDLSQTNGTFAVQVGSATGATKRTLSDQGLAMPTVFANNGQILAASTSNCTAGYTPATNDGRLLRVAVTNGGSTVTISPDLQINSVPNAMVAETLQGYTPTTFKNIPGTITTNSTSTFRIESEFFNFSSGNCSGSRGTGFATASYSSSGPVCVVTFTTPFSATPVCTVSGDGEASYNALYCRLATGSSGTTVSCFNSAGTQVPDNFALNCQGPR